MGAIRFFLFSNLCIAVCALGMSWETLHFFSDPAPEALFILIFGGTLLAYNLHWLLCLRTPHELPRIRWCRQYTWVLWIGAMAGLVLSVNAAWQFRAQWIWLLPAVMVTAIYTLPKVEAFSKLRSYATGKTFLLALAWTYVTTLMPMLLTETPLSPPWLHFTLGRFFLVYAICLLFDHRDVETDIAEGLSTLPSRITEKQLRWVYYFCLLWSVFFMASSTDPDRSNTLLILIRILPSLILFFLFNPAIRHSSQGGSPQQREETLLSTPYHLPPTTLHSQNDLFYYGLLDGLMAASAFLSFLASF